MKTTKRYGIGIMATVSALALAAAASGCASDTSGPGAVQGQAEMIDLTRQPLGAGVIKWVNGTYGVGCIGKASGTWSARVSGVAAMDNTALSVVTNNTACTLTLTEIVADQTYPATPTIAMGSSYAGSASTFLISAALKFYGNAKLSATTFGADFVVSVLFSDDPNAVTGSVTASHSFVNATSTATSVTSPNYTVSFVTGSFAVLTDASNIVTSVSGTANLTDGTQTGSAYVINNGTLATTPTFAQIDTAYTAGTPVTISGANPTIAASAFGLSAVDLTSPVVRTIIIKTATSGVLAYQTIKVTIS